MYGFGLGKEVTMDLELDTIGSLATVGLIKNFSVRQRSNLKVVKPVNNGGVPQARTSEEGWDLEFTITRQNGVLDKLAQLLQDTFYAGKTQLYATFTETIQNQDGTIDQFKYPHSVVWVPNHLSNVQQDEEIDQTLSGYCPKRSQVK